MLGDVIELLGAACLVAAAYLIAGIAAGLIVAGVSLVYEGNCLGATPLPKLSFAWLAVDWPWRRREGAQ